MSAKFTTITAEDWRRSIKRSRETPNEVREALLSKSIELMPADIDLRQLQAHYVAAYLGISPKKVLKPKKKSCRASR